LTVVSGELSQSRGQLHHDQRPGPRRRRPRALGERRGALQLAGSV